MKTFLHAAPRERRGYLLNEALVYCGAVVVLLGVGYAALYRCVDNSTVLRRSADDIARALSAGERWRNDVRKAAAGVTLESSAEASTLHLKGEGRSIDYRFAEGRVWRRSDAGPWVYVLEGVRASRMVPEPRGSVNGWRWELELQPQARGSVRPGRIVPLFTFLTVSRAPLNR
jgi:hypothetical protein